MAIQWQSIPLNFSQGVDTKTDPNQVQIGKFLSLENTVFSKGGLLQKRYGFASLASLPDNTSNYLSTFNGALTAVGARFNAYSAGSESWVDKGAYKNAELETIPLVRSNANQTLCDSATAPNGLVCTAYLETIPAGRNPLSVAKYAIFDSVTGQNIVPPSAIPVTTGTVSVSRVFVLGNNFIILFYNTVSAVPRLQYVSISISNPTSVSINATISSSFLGSFDAYVANNLLYIAWNGADVGGALRVATLSSTLVLSSPVVFAALVGDIISVAADITTSTPVIYITAFEAATQNGSILAVNPALATVLAPTLFTSGVDLVGTALAAQNGVATIFWQVLNFYSYAPSVRTDYVQSRTCTQTGTLGTSAVVLRSVTLASKAFIVDGEIYFLCEYISTYQPTYFLVDSSGNIYAKMAYQNGGPSSAGGWASVTVNGSSAQVSYLFKSLIQAVNKSTNTGSATQTAGIYSQTGINLATFTLGTSDVSSAEIGRDLNLSGGILWSYDGLVGVENGFNVYPDSVSAAGDYASTGQIVDIQQYFYQVTYEWTDNQGNAFKSAPSLPISYTILTPPANLTGLRTSGSPTLTSVSSFTNLQVGQPISGAGIPANTFILSMDTGSATLTMTANATSGTATLTTVTPTAVTAIMINVPTLRLTYKIANPVKIVIYRYSIAQPTYYQVTSLTTPVFNDPTVDSVSWSDRLGDATIIGNNILYTTGGVIENIGPPASSAVTLFDNRLWLLDAEDRNLLWFSKQVIESTPVEMSDLLTMYVAPTTGAQGSTGPSRCIFPMDDKLIIFKDNAAYYVNGRGPDNTGANSQYSDPTFITSSVGCANQRSIVLIPQGLMFQSNKGIWLLGRDLSTSYIGAPVEIYNGATVKSALVVPGTNQVRFTLDSGTTLMYDYFYGQWGTFKGIPGVSSVIFEGLHSYINSLGEAFQESPNAYLDGSNPVEMSFSTGWINATGLQGFERASDFYLLGKYLSPHKLYVQVAYDYGPAANQQVVINPDNYSNPYGDDPSYGSGSPYGGAPDLEQWSVSFERQKCQAFRLTINEVYDPSYGVPAGAGLTMSGLNLTVGLKGSRPKLPASRQVG